MRKQIDLVGDFSRFQAKYCSDSEIFCSDLQHELWRMTIKGSMHLSPLIANSLQNSLDVGTGTGAW